MRSFLPMILGTATVLNPVIILFLTLASLGFGQYFNFCKDVSHGSFFEYGCCNGTMLDYGIDFQAHWKGCTDPENTGDHVQDSMWAMYACIVKRSMENRKQTLSNYARAMTAGFPARIREKVTKLARSTDLADASDDKMSNAPLNRVRIAYHKIEKEVCTGQSAESEDWTKCDDGLDSLRENQHLRGDCCLSLQIPIRLTYLRRQPSEVSQDCTLKMAQDAGLIKKYSGFLEIGYQKTFLNKPHEQSDVRSMCLQTCVFKSDFQVSKPYSTEPFNFTSWIPNFITFLPASTQEAIIRRINEDEMNKQADEYVESILDNLLQTDFTVYTDRHQVRNVLRMCEANNVAVRHIEGALTEICTEV